jgi:membrane protease YdiL (CAAX protease family)
MRCSAGGRKSRPRRRLLTVYCPSCGNSNADTSRFCTRCGASLTGDPATVTAAEMAPTIVVNAPVDQKQQVANYWHTAVLVVLMLLLSFSGAARVQKVSQHGPKPLLYATTIVMQLIILGFVYIGVRRRGYTLRQLMGERWRGFDSVMIDIAIAAGFWIAVAIILATLAKLMGLAAKAEEMRKALDFLAPATARDLALWVVLSVNAGFCEEIIYRGYLQRQFASLARSVPLGVIISAVVFGASHGYEGGARMIIIAVFGACLGTLAALRKNLRPGMIAHGWHDAFAGTGLFLLRRLGR